MRTAVFLPRVSPGFRELAAGGGRTVAIFLPRVSPGCLELTPGGGRVDAVFFLLDFFADLAAKLGAAAMPATDVAAGAGALIAGSEGMLVALLAEIAWTFSRISCSFTHVSLVRVHDRTLFELKYLF